MTNGKKNKAAKLFTPIKDNMSSKNDTNDEMVSISLNDLESLIDTKLEEQRQEYENKMKLLEEKLDTKMAATTEAMAVIVENRFKVIDGLNTEIAEIQRSLGHAHSDTAKLGERITKVDSATANVNKDVNVLVDRAADAEDRARRWNLKFFDLEEQTKGFENCEAKIKELVARVRNINADDVWLDRAHRLGKYDSKKTRPIIAKFTYYTDKERMLKASRAIDTETRPFGISEDFSKETYDVRRQLMAHLKNAKVDNTDLTGHLNYKILVLKFNNNANSVYSRVSLADIENYPHDWFKQEFKDIKNQAAADNRTEPATS